MATESSWPFNTQGGAAQEVTQDEDARRARMLAKAQNTDTGVDALGWYGNDPVLTPARSGSFPGSLRVTRNGSGLLEVASGQALVQGFAYRLTAGPKVLTPTANPAGSAGDRYDSVVLRLNRSGLEVGGTPVSSITCALVEGVAAANPAPPALTQDDTDDGVWEFRLATWRLKQGASTYASNDDTATIKELGDKRVFLRYQPAGTINAESIVDGGDNDIWVERTSVMCRFYVPASGRWVPTVAARETISNGDGRAMISYKVYAGDGTGGELIVDKTEARSAVAQTTDPQGADHLRQWPVSFEVAFEPGLYTMIAATRNAGAGTATFHDAYVVAAPSP